MKSTRAPSDRLARVERAPHGRRDELRVGLFACYDEEVIPSARPSPGLWPRRKVTPRGGPTRRFAGGSFLPARAPGRCARRFPINAHVQIEAFDMVESLSSFKLRSMKKVFRHLVLNVLAGLAGVVNSSAAEGGLYFRKWGDKFCACAEALRLNDHVIPGLKFQSRSNKSSQSSTLKRAYLMDAAAHWMLVFPGMNTCLVRKDQLKVPANGTAKAWVRCDSGTPEHEFKLITLTNRGARTDAEIRLVQRYEKTDLSPYKGYKGEWLVGGAGPLKKEMGSYLKEAVGALDLKQQYAEVFAEEKRQDRRDADLRREMAAALAKLKSRENVKGEDRELVRSEIKMLQEQHDSLGGSKIEASERARKVVAQRLERCLDEITPVSDEFPGLVFVLKKRLGEYAPGEPAPLKQSPASGHGS